MTDFCSIEMLVYVAIVKPFTFFSYEFELCFMYEKIILFSLVLKLDIFPRIYCRVWNSLKKGHDILKPEKCGSGQIFV